jgi:hypothetical protein
MAHHLAARNKVFPLSTKEWKRLFSIKENDLLLSGQWLTAAVRHMAHLPAMNGPGRTAAMRVLAA